MRLTPYLRGAHLFLATGRVDDENLGAVYALAAECPVVVTSANTAASVLKGTHYSDWVCPVGDVACMTKHVLAFIQNPGVRDEFRINAKHVLLPKLSGFGGNHYDAMVAEWRKTFTT